MGYADSDRTGQTRIARTASEISAKEESIVWHDCAFDIGGFFTVSATHSLSRELLLFITEYIRTNNITELERKAQNRIVETNVSTHPSTHQ